MFSIVTFLGTKYLSNRHQQNVGTNRKCLFQDLFFNLVKQLQKITKCQYRHLVNDALSQTQMYNWLISKHLLMMINIWDEHWHYIRKYHCSSEFDCGRSTVRPSIISVTSKHYHGMSVNFVTKIEHERKMFSQFVPQEQSGVQKQ